MDAERRSHAHNAHTLQTLISLCPDKMISRLCIYSILFNDE